MRRPCRWGSRLAIARRGGGFHFSEQEMALADSAYARVAPLYAYVTAASQLAEKAELLPRLLETLNVQKQLSKHQKVEKAAAAQKAAIELLERLGSTAALPPMRRRFSQARLPDSLPTSLMLTRRALPEMLRGLLALAADEHDQWELESTAKRRFRTPRTHQLHHAVLQVAAEQRKHELIGPELSADDRAAIVALEAREAKLDEAARAANAALAADDYDEAV